MILSETDRHLLSLVQLNADISAAALARRLGLKRATVYYHLSRLEREGVIRRGAFVDLHALGYQVYEVLFALSPKRRNAKEQLIHSLSNHSQVLWLAELGADFHFGVSFIARNAGDASEFLESLTAKHGDIFARKIVSQTVSYTAFRKKYLMPDLPVTLADSLSFGKAAATCDCDESDLRIIGALYDPGLATPSEMAKKIGIPRTTIEYRIRRLIDKKIVRRRIFYMGASALGALMYKLVISAQGAQRTLTKDLFEFALHEPSVTGFIHSLGYWDYSLSVEPWRAEDIVPLTERLYERFGTSLHDTRTIPVFRQTTSRGFLRSVS